MTQPHRTIEGPAILDRLHDALTRYVVLPSPEAIDATVLWIAATHAQQAWAHAPRLVIRAPEKRCGKSRLLDIVEGTCANPLITVNASTAAVYRSIGSDDPPTLLVDEADTIFGGKAAEANEELRGLLNAGHQRNRPTIRWDNTNRKVEKIATFAMAALAGIGAMPDTIEDRAVVIRMRRRAPGEQVKPYRHRRDGVVLRQLANDLTEWLHAHHAVLEKAEPDMPLEDRAADTWEPLIAVADLAGGDWPDRGREAALTLTAERDSNGVTSDRVRLLTDCRRAFGTADALPTVVLLDRLKADPEAPWNEYSNGAGLTAMRLGMLLKEYDITSGNIRFTPEQARSYNLLSDQAKGYQRGDFQDAWQRYCPPLDPDTEASRTEPSQPSHPSSSQGRLAPVVRLKPSQPTPNTEIPPPVDHTRGPVTDARGTA